MKYLSAAPLAESLTAPRVINVRDDRETEPVSDELYETFVQQFAYDPSTLNETIERTDESRRGFVRERVSFDAGYRDDRTIVHLFLPDHVDPPYKTVVYFPGLYAFKTLVRATTTYSSLADRRNSSSRAGSRSRGLSTTIRSKGGVAALSGYRAPNLREPVARGWLTGDKI